MFGRATIRLGIGPHSSFFFFLLFIFSLVLHVTGGQQDGLKPFLATCHSFWQINFSVS